MGKKFITAIISQLFFLRIISWVTNYSSILAQNFSVILHETFLQSDWLRAVVLQLNLHLHVKITNLLRVVV